MMSQTSKDELVAALRPRYQRASRCEKQQVLNEDRGPPGCTLETGPPTIPCYNALAGSSCTKRSTQVPRPPPAGAGADSEKWSLESKRVP